MIILLLQNLKIFIDNGIASRTKKTELVIQLPNRICKKENNSLRKVRAFIREYLPYVGHIYDKNFAKGLPLPKLRNRKSRYYIEFNEISEFLKKYNC